MSFEPNIADLDLSRKGEQAIAIAGPAGQIEAKLVIPEQQDRFEAVAIICHPHPLHGGSMNNKVVFTLSKAMSNLGVPNIRFNFRGVGKSDGSFADTIGETEDAMAVINYAKRLLPQHVVWIAGFSFGAYIALRVSQQKTIQQLITIAPAVNLYDLKDFEAPQCPWLLVQGREDEIVPVTAVENWISHISPRPQLNLLSDTGHFFHGKLVELREIIEGHIQATAS